MAWEKLVDPRINDSFHELMHPIKGLGRVQANDPDKDSYSVSFIQHEVRCDIHAS